MARREVRVTHPNVLAALAALARLTTAWAYLADQLVPGPAAPTGERILTPAARGRMDRQVRAERADLVEQRRAGLTPAGASPAPLRVSVLDGQTIALSTVCEAAWIVTSALRTRAVPIGPQLTWTPYGDDSERFRGAAGYLAVTLPLIPVELAATIGADLDQADRLARAVAGVGSDRRPVRADCPACGRRSLQAEVGSTDQREWFIRCARPECRCQGIDCGCQMALRYPGAGHIWPSRRFGELARLFDRLEGSAA